MLLGTAACRNAVLMSPILSFHPFARDIAIGLMKNYMLSGASVTSYYSIYH